MRKFIIAQLRTLKVKDDNKLIAYVDYCLDNALEKSIKYKSQNHHILPKTPFKEYEMFSKAPWNKSRLLNDKHYIAHAMLSSAIDFDSFHYAWYAMNNKNYTGTETQINLIGAERYGVLTTQRNKSISTNAKKYVMCKDLITDNNVRVLREKYESDPNLVGVTTGRGGEHLKGTLSVLDVNGKTIRIKKEDYNANEMTHANANKATYKDSNGAIFLIGTQDKRVLNGELVGYMKNRTSKHKGINHNKFKGYYITPWGKFPTPREAHESFPNHKNVYISESMIKNYCKYKKIITKNTITSSEYFNKNYKLVGTTYSNSGFEYQKLK